MRKYSYLGSDDGRKPVTHLLSHYDTPGRREASFGNFWHMVLLYKALVRKHKTSGSQPGTDVPQGVHLRLATEGKNIYILYIYHLFTHILNYKSSIKNAVGFCYFTQLSCHEKF